MLSILAILTAAGAIAALDPPDTMDQFEHFIQSVGFPAVVAIYVLVRLERTIGNLNQIMNEIKGMLALALVERDVKRP